MARSCFCSDWGGVQTVVVTYPPARVPGLNVSASDSNGDYTVSWGAVATATSYTLEERTNGGNWATEYSGGSRGRGRSGRTDGHYSYRVRGCYVSGCGSWSATRKGVGSGLAS